MLKLAEENDDQIAQARALCARAISHGYQGDNQASLENATRAEIFAS